MRYQMRVMSWVMFGTAFFGFSAYAASVSYTGSGADPSDISKADNWDPSTWTAADNLSLSGSKNAQNYKMTSAFPAAAKLTLTGFSNVRTVDFGGFLTSVPQLVADGNGWGQKITLKGGADDLTRLECGMNTFLVLDDGVFHVGTGILRLNSYNPNLWINSGAEVVVDTIPADNYCGTANAPQSHTGYMCLDGGKLTVKGVDAGYSLQTVSFYGGDNKFEMLNGAVLENDALAPRLAFDSTDEGGARGRMRIVDSTVLMTNCSHGSSGMLIHPHASSFEATRSTLKFSQFYCGAFGAENYDGRGTEYAGGNAKDSTFTFTDSTVLAAFRPGSSYADYSGIFLGPKTYGNTVTFEGSSSEYSGKIFALGGETNTLKVSAGTFAATSRFDFAPGHQALAQFSGGVSTLGYVQSRNTNSTFAVAGTARVNVMNGDFNCSVDGAGVIVTGGCLSVTSDCCFQLRAGGNSVLTAGEGAVTTGKVRFAGSNGRVVVADGARHVSMRSAKWETGYWSGVTYEGGCDGDVLVVSNAVFECAMPFAKNCCEVTAEGPKSDAVPFTGCPNCRIELIGADARFLVTSRSRYEGDDIPWYSCALGEMLDRSGATPTWTTQAYPLDNPVRVRFCIPAGGWSEAPFRVTERVAVLGGNAEFEFDASGYQWPEKTTRVPLIYNASCFKGWSERLYVNVKQLNETNAARLPVNPRGRKAKLALSADGSTLDLVMPGMGGLVLVVR